MAIRHVRTIIFAKAPIPGFSKTRLIPALGSQGAAVLARRMLQGTLAAAIEADIGPVELCVTPSPDSKGWREETIAPGVELTDQGSGDLGERMAGAAERGIARGEPVLLVGTDCVEMSPTLLRRVAARLLQGADALIHPTADGGYAVLGLNRFSHQLFRAIPWGTDRVAATSIARLRELGWTFLSEAILHDVDTPEDLRCFPGAWSE